MLELRRRSLGLNGPVRHSRGAWSAPESVYIETGLQQSVADDCSPIVEDGARRRRTTILEGAMRLVVVFVHATLIFSRQGPHSGAAQPVRIKPMLHRLPTSSLL